MLHDFVIPPVPTGTTAGKLVQLDSSAKLPVVDGSQLTSLSKAAAGLENVTNHAQLKAADLDTDGTLAANSDTKIPSQKAVKTYVAAQSGGGGLYLSPRYLLIKSTEQLNGCVPTPSTTEGEEWHCINDSDDYRGDMADDPADFIDTDSYLTCADSAKQFYGAFASAVPSFYGTFVQATFYASVTIPTGSANLYMSFGTGGLPTGEFLATTGTQILSQVVTAAELSAASLSLGNFANWGTGASAPYFLVYTGDNAFRINQMWCKLEFTAPWIDSEI